MKVLIGYDGSKCADDAIADLKRAGLPDDTDATVLAVADVFPPLPASSFSAAGPPTSEYVATIVKRARELARQAMDEARVLSEGAATRLRSLFPRWTVRAEAAADTPHWALVAKAAQLGVDLIVVGSNGRTALGRVLLGSVSQQVLHHSPCSVRIARGDAEAANGADNRPVRLVLGVDGSVGSATATSAVDLRTWPTGSEVLVVGVIDSHAILAGMEFVSTPGSPPGAGSDQASRLQDSLKSVGEELRRSGLAVTTSLLMGDPKRALLNEAERFAADCIFVGAKGHSRLERLLLGSVSGAVAARAHCSVEVVRAG